MKTICLFAILLFSFPKLIALPVGNPAQASLFHRTCALDLCSSDEEEQDFFLDVLRLNVGFYGNYVFERHLETVTNRQIDYCQLMTNAVYIALNFCEKLEIFTTLGATKIKFNTSLGPFNAGNIGPRFDFESETAFSWSVGAHATIWECGKMAFGMMGQYFETHLKPHVLFVRANVDDRPDESTRRQYSEWQVGAGLSYRYNKFFVPYVALKYNHIFWDFDNQTFSVTGTPATIPSLRNSHRVGYAIGLTLAPFKCKKMAVTVEGRFADEAALHANAQLQF